MVRVREISTTAAFAWSHSIDDPQIATGTKAGAVDADFSNETVLELWDLGLGNASATSESRPRGSITVDSRFHAVGWSAPTSTYKSGIIAGALESGSLCLWDATKLQASSQDALISSTSKHSGAIKALQFNPHRDDLLASAGAKGELYITNLGGAVDPFRLGTGAARADDFDALDWNKKVPHILVTGTNGGFATVWDVRAKKESINLNNYGRKPVSAIAWDPTTPTKLATATSYDQEPVILMWDLRNSNAPERILKHHDQGILSLSWSIADPRLLLSCGKDNRTVCWNAQTGEVFGEFPIVTNWTFQTTWNPKHPGLLATASFDGKIAVQTLQNTNPDTAENVTAGQALDDADFFASAQNRPQGASFNLPVAPVWLNRPVSATFGFGGRLVRVQGPDAGSKDSKVSISSFNSDPAIAEASQRFEETLQNGDFKSVCDAKIDASTTEQEKADWTVIETLISKSRENLKQYLGFATQVPHINGSLEATEGKPAKTEVDDNSFFDNADGSDNFLAGFASSKGAKTNSPFKVYSGKESEADKAITRALILGNFDEALEICLKEKRMSDALMIAISGGHACIEKAKTAYFQSSTDAPNYVRLLASFSNKNLWDMVYNIDLGEWKDAVAAICTYADEKDFSDLCEALGDRLDESNLDSKSRKDASFCYLAGSRLEKVVSIWLQELKEAEESLVGSSTEHETHFAIHAASLQSFIEKVTVFRQITGFTDADHSNANDWKLAPLYAKYVEYADILASQGQLKTAEKYLDLLPAQYPSADIARNRVRKATTKRAVAGSRTTAAVSSQRPQQIVSNFQPVSTASVPAASTTPSPYAPAGATNAIPKPAPFVAAAQPGPAQYNPPGYQNQQGYGQQNSSYGAIQNYGASYGGYGAAPPPSRVMTQSPAVPAPSQNLSNVPQWNDTPDVFGAGKPAARRAAPNVHGPPLSSPYNNQPAAASPTNAYGAPPKSVTPVPPPPKAGAPRVASPSTFAPPAPQLERATSSVASSYAPPAVVPSPAQFQTVPRSGSPYNAPPQAGASSGRYAPTPGTQPTAPLNPVNAPSSTLPFAPPRSSSYGVAAPMQQSTAAAVAPAPPPKAAAPPPKGPPPKGTARTAPSPANTPARNVALPSPQPSDSRPGSPAIQAAPAAAAPKHPPGDRSHIPPTDMPAYEGLHNEMQRIKSKAPQAYIAQVLDTEKRLNILFDHLNNRDVLTEDTISRLKSVAQSIQGRQHDEATSIITDLMTNRSAEGSNWMVGVKRLIMMSKATPL